MFTRFTFKWVFINIAGKSDNFLFYKSLIIYSQFAIKLFLAMNYPNDCQPIHLSICHCMMLLILIVLFLHTQISGVSLLSCHKCQYFYKMVWTKTYSTVSQADERQNNNRIKNQRSRVCYKNISVKNTYYISHPVSVIFSQIL